MEWLPLGSLVILNESTQKIVIMSRLALYQSNGKNGYFDYCACLYPYGMTPTQSIFFNQEDIKEIFQEGFSDSQEIDFQKVLDAEKSKTKLKHLTVHELR